MRKKITKVVAFDEDSRRDFVTGFHKRKLARKKKAAEDFEKQLREAKMKIKQQARETYKKIIHPVHTILHATDTSEIEHKLPEHIVKVTQLTPDEIAEQNNWIGMNRMRIHNDYEDKKAEETKTTVSYPDPIPGMSVTSLKEVKKIVNHQVGAFMQNDKIFKQKNKLERLKNRKKAARKRNLLKREQKKLKGRKKK